MDRELRHQILRASIKDAAFLRNAWKDVSADDFTEREESAVVKVAINFYEKYGEPIAGMLRNAIEQEVARSKWGQQAREKLQKLLDKLLAAKMEPVSVRALVDAAKELKRKTFYEKAVDKIIGAMENGGLESALLQDIVTDANRELATDPVLYSDVLQESIVDRVRRRSNEERYREYPLLYIGPLDQQVQVIGPGHLGMVMALPGGGKSLALCHIDIAYARQKLRGVHFTLEDPKPLVEKRLDAAITRMPLSRMGDLTKKITIRDRYERALKGIRGKIRVVDATDGSWSISKMERVLEQFRQDGYEYDFVVIDYDDEIICEKQFKGESARRFEFAEIYRRLRVLAKNNNKIVWVAAQASRDAVGKKIISSKHVAEDFSKIRKVFFALTITRKEADVHWLHVVKHRLDRQDFGFPVVSNFSKAIFIDEEATEEYLERLEK